MPLLLSSQLSILLCLEDLLDPSKITTFSLFFGIVFALDLLKREYYKKTMKMRFINNDDSSSLKLRVLPNDPKYLKTVI